MIDSDLHRQRAEMIEQIAALHSEQRAARSGPAPDAAKVDALYRQASELQGRLTRLNREIKERRIAGVPVGPSGRAHVGQLMRECGALAEERDSIQRWLDWLRDAADPACSCRPCRSLLKGKSAPERP